MNRLFLLLLCSYLSTIVISQCPSNQWKYTPGKCIYLSQKSSDSNTNDETCKSQSGTQIMLLSEEEHKNLKSLLLSLSDKNRYRLGVRNNPFTNKQWQWNNKEVSTLPGSSWETGVVPDTTDGKHCAGIDSSSGLLFKEKCPVELFEACELRVKHVPQPDKDADKGASAAKVEELQNQLKDISGKMNEAIKGNEEKMETLKGEMTSKINKELENIKNTESQVNNKFQSLSGEMKQLSESINKANSDTVNNVKNMDDKVSKLASSNQEINNKVSQLETNLKNNMDANTAEVSKISNGMKDVQSKLKESEANNKDVADNIKGLKGDMKTVEESVSKISNEVKSKIENFEKALKETSDLSKNANSEKLKEFDENMKKVKETLMTVESKNQESLKKVDELEKSTQNKINTISDEAKKLSNEVNELKSKLTEADSSKKNLDESVNNLKGQVSNFESSLSNIAASNKDTDDKVTKLNENVMSKLSASEAESKKLLNDFNELKQKVQQNENVKSEIEEIKKQINPQELAAFKNDISQKFTQQSEDLKKSDETMNKKIQELQSELKKVSQNSNAQESLNTMTSSMQQFKQELENIKEDKKKIDEKFNLNAEETKKLRDELGELKSKIKDATTLANADHSETLKNMNSKIQNFEKNFETIKTNNKETNEQIKAIQSDVNTKINNVVDESKKLKDDISELKTKANSFDKLNKEVEEIKSKLNSIPNSSGISTNLNEKLIDEKLEKMKQELTKMIGSNSIQSGSKDVMDFSKNLDQLSKRLGVHARFTLSNDLSIQKLTAIVQQLKNAVENPAVYEGCPLGWSQSNGKCYFVGPKATFKENKDYCELFNATMVRVTEAFVNDLVKLEPHKPHWLASSDAKPSDDCQAYLPLSGQTINENCEKKFVQLCKM